MITKVLFLICTYLISSIPFGLLICKIFKKIDIREFGSKSIGATNVARTVGKKYAVAVFLLDGLKAFFPVLISKYLFLSNYFQAMVFFIAVIGHIYSFWLMGKGGKGISSTIWGLFAFNYLLALIIVLAWIITFKITRISAFASLFSTFIMTISSFFMCDIRCFSILMILMIIIFWAHRENIKRMLNKEEMDFKKNEKI